MTDQGSLDDIAVLLMRYPGVTSAVAFPACSDQSVWIRFRCCDFGSLGAIASCSVAANLVIEVGDLQGRLCGERTEAAELPFDMKIDDCRDDTPTSCQIFGIFLARDLKKRNLLDVEVADRLQRDWNAVPM